MKHDNMLLNKTSQWVRGCFQYIHCKHCIFHNYDHTKETVAAGKEIAVGLQVSDDELETVLLACWFHDLGLLYALENHEKKSAEEAEAFLKKNTVKERKIKAVKTCILATRMPQKPAAILEKIVCDADISHLGKENYFKKNTLLRQEFELNREKSYSDLEWWLLNKEFFQEHQYFTPYARQRYSKQKDLNLMTILNLLEKVRRSNSV
jgi:predicted metal-dependent HD superfamily phosphohydrolase